MTPTSVKVQVAPDSLPSVPSWLGEVTIVAHVFTQFELIRAIAERVRFARARFGIYDVIDFAVVLLGYAVSGEATLEDFYERLLPIGPVFMALFGRANLPSRSALSRYLSALDQPAVEELRTLFQEDLVARLSSGWSPGGLRDRQGKRWLVTDVDGTRQTARQRALPHTTDLPAPHRRMDLVCAPGYPGRKRGEVVRTRTTILQAHTNHWLGTFSGSGNGDYRGELLRAIQVIISYAKALSVPLSQVLVRLDGLYGDAAPLRDILTTGLGVIVRGRDYALLDRPSVQAILSQSPDQATTHPERGTRRALFDCQDIALTPVGPSVRMIVATHPATSTPAPVGSTRESTVYEIFFTTLPPQAFTPADVLHLYFQRGSFETVLADEDQEQDLDRWVSHTPCGQEFWQILSQWLWNIRIELGQQLSPAAMRLTELVPAGVVASASTAQTVASLPTERPIERGESAPRRGPAQATPPVEYGPPTFSDSSSSAGFAGSAFSLQPDGTLLCPAEHPLYPQERRLARNGSLRIVYAARIGHCRSCPLRPQCQGSSNSQVGPRRVSAVCQPLSSSPSPTVAAAVDGPSSPIEPAPALVELLPLPTSLEGPIHLVESAPTKGLAQATVGYGPPTFSDSSSNAGFAGSAFSLQPDGTLLCPAEHPLYPQERRLARNGSLRIVYAARLWHCRSCPLRSQCQGPSTSQLRPRRVSAVCQPLSSSPPTTVEVGDLAIDGSSAPIESAPTLLEPASATVASEAVQVDDSSPPIESVPAPLEPSSPLTPCPVLWEDWPVGRLRRQWIKLLRTQTVLLTPGPVQVEKITSGADHLVLTRTQRAHWRLSWSERLARNARGPSAPSLEITIHGLPASFAQAFALGIAA